MAFVWALKSGGWKWFSHVTTVQCSINKHGTWKDDETFPLVMEPFATLMMKLDDLPIKSWPLSWQTVRLPPGIIQYSPTYNDNSPIISPFYNVCWLLHFFLQCLFIICFSIFLGVWIPKTSPKIPVLPDPPVACPSHDRGSWPRMTLRRTSPSWRRTEKTGWMVQEGAPKLGYLGFQCITRTKYRCIMIYPRNKRKEIELVMKVMNQLSYHLPIIWAAICGNPVGRLDFMAMAFNGGVAMP